MKFTKINNKPDTFKALKPLDRVSLLTGEVVKVVRHVSFPPYVEEGLIVKDRGGNIRIYMKDLI